MDFDALDTKADAERGATLHLKHPQLGHLLYSGEGADKVGRVVDAKRCQPVTVAILGPEADAFARAFRAWERLPVHEREDTGKQSAMLSRIIVGMTGVTRKVDGKTVDVLPNPEGIQYLLSRSKMFVAQMMEFAGDSSNFFNSGLEG